MHRGAPFRLCAMKREFYYGGQALIEGVMMRGQRHSSFAVRRPNGSIALATLPLHPLYSGSLRRAPLLRGILVLAETLTLGMRALIYSAKAAIGEEEEIPKGAMGGVVLFALLFAVALFFVFPYLISRLLAPLVSHNLLNNLMEGLLRLLVFIAYLKLIGRWSEISRVFAYHGAEHKVVNAFETGVPLEIPQVKLFSTAHLRCGTSFMLIVMVIAIPIFALIGAPSPLLALPMRLALLPVIAALSYEIIRLGAAHAGNGMVGWLLRPGLWLQSLTTREPDEGQIEVAIAALNEVLAAEGVSSAPPAVG